MNLVEAGHVDLANDLQRVSPATVAATLKQKLNKNTGKKEWALVSKSDSSKILKWFGAKKPSEEAVQKEERRVNYFKHVGSNVVADRTDLTTKDIEKLRKDFLTLMKNTKRLKSYDQAMKLKEALRTWKDHVEQLVKEVKQILKDDDSNDSKWLLKNAGKVWDLLTELRSMPLEPMGLIEKYEPGITKETVFDRYKANESKWESRLKRVARDTWKWFNLAIESLERRGKSTNILLREREKANIEGFRMEIFGYDSTDSEHAEMFGRLKQSLRTYKAQAKKMYPILLKYQVPMTANFVDEQRNRAASYANGHIEITRTGMYHLKELPKVLAHEMAHHIYQKVMSKERRNLWHTLVTGKYKNLDLNEVLKKAKPGESLPKMRFRLEREDPVLYLQLEALSPRGDGKLASMRGIQEYLEEGNDPVVQVPVHPITGYGATNPEEGFAEAIGLLVAYGPRTLKPEVRQALSIVAPGLVVKANVKAASAKDKRNSATQYLKETHKRLDKSIRQGPIAKALKSEDKEDLRRALIDVKVSGHGYTGHTKRLKDWAREKIDDTTAVALEKLNSEYSKWYDKMEKLYNNGDLKDTAKELAKVKGLYKKYDKPVTDLPAYHKI